ncbi:hypothetical protein O3P69_007206 [Scylla paramamosain]|uniref:Uncharacterized protein n=1 Tax=Scylla paramamosain TaxID=85552 RepID=A0AAW0V4K0_SCYPA
MRMDPQMFDEVDDRLSLRIILQDTNWIKFLEPGLNVAVTLRYLGSVDRYPNLSFCIRISHHTITKFLPLLCQAIVDEYKGPHMCYDGWPLGYGQPLSYLLHRNGVGTCVLRRLQQESEWASITIPHK